ncbi:MAG: nitrous oxide reductase accessory protein NosL [Nitrospiraceae bacterium]|nr:nitrous oxide reductase accessory protein NosL [Nitrospiraceae bacterium]
MKCRKSIIFAAWAALVFCAVFAVRAMAQTQYRIPPGAKCAECGMGINPNSPFVCFAVTNGGQFLYFDEPGEMLIHIRNMKDIKTIRVKDFATGRWVDGRAAYYVKSKEFKTPMRWDIAAFAAVKDAGARGNALPWGLAFSLLQ